MSPLPVAVTIPLAQFRDFLLPTMLLIETLRRDQVPIFPDTLVDVTPERICITYPGLSVEDKETSLKLASDFMLSISDYIREESKTSGDLTQAFAVTRGPFSNGNDIESELYFQNHAADTGDLIIIKNVVYLVDARGNRTLVGAARSDEKEQTHALVDRLTAMAKEFDDAET